MYIIPGSHQEGSPGNNVGLLEISWGLRKRLRILLEDQHSCFDLRDCFIFIEIMIHRHHDHMEL